MSTGACYVAYGDRSRSEAEQSMATLRQHNDLPVSVAGERPIGDQVNFVAYPPRDKIGRWAKLNIDNWSPYDYTLYIDADTRVHGDVSAGFAILADGWDIAITASQSQGGELLWHVGEADRLATLAALENSEPLQLQAGVFYFRKSDAVRLMFTAWREEWVTFGNQDQGALLRALFRVPECRVWILGRCWNGGELIEHLFGATRR